MNDSASRSPEAMQTLAHELRNRIAPIRNAAALIRMRSGNDAALEKLVQIIERQLEGLTGALDEALAAGTDTAAERSMDAPAPRSGTASAGVAMRRSRRILIADDSAAIRESLAEVLRENGHDVQSAADGEQALQLAAQWLPEVVLLDVNMPRINGYETARRLRAQFAPEAMKLVMMSGVSLDTATRRSAKRAGFDHCMDKVFDLATFEALLADD